MTWLLMVAAWCCLGWLWGELKASRWRAEQWESLARRLQVLAAESETCAMAAIAWANALSSAITHGNDHPRTQALLDQANAAMQRAPKP